MTDSYISRAVVRLDMLLAAATMVADETDTRLNIKGVEISPSPQGGVILAATDGWTMCAIHCPDAAFEGATSIWRVPSRELKKLLAGADKQLLRVGTTWCLLEGKKGTGNAAMRLRQCDRSQEVLDGHGTTLGAVEDKDIKHTMLIHQTFPMWESLVKVEPDPQPVPYWIRCDHLAKLAALAAAISPRTAPASISIQRTSAKHVHASFLGHPEVVAVLMPSKAEDPTPIGNPEWLQPLLPLPEDVEVDPPRDAEPVTPELEEAA